MEDASALEFFLRATNQKRLKIDAVIYPDPLITYSNVLPFIKKMAVMGSSGLGFATFGVVCRW